MRIDAHQHFWIYDANRDSWITDEMSGIQRDFMPNDLAQELRNNEIDGTIAVQASQSPEETQFLVDLSAIYAMIKGVVGWVDLADPNIEEVLMRYKKTAIIKGFRHVVEGEDDPNFLVKPDIQNGLEALTRQEYTYDLLIRPRHFESTLKCVASNPNLQFILDHMAKPNIKDGEGAKWFDFISELSKFNNVACKISGLATEANWNSWELTDFAKYIDHVIAVFGNDRIIFGSDWPVCLLSANYTDNLKIMKSRTQQFSDQELRAFMGENARRIYHI